MTIYGKVEKALFFMLRDIVSPISPSKCTKLMVTFYRRHGMRILGKPNYLSAKTWFDGADYARIELNEGCTVSSFVRFLTHDWAMYTILRGLGLQLDSWIGTQGTIRIGKYAFVGTGCILMPGADVGKAALIGSGSVIRGIIPDYAIVAGSPAEQIGDVREYARKKLAKMGRTDLIDRINELCLPNIGSQNFTSIS